MSSPILPKFFTPEMRAEIADDITFCMSDCQALACRRHPTNIRCPGYPHSYSAFKGTELCMLPRYTVTLRDGTESVECAESIAHLIMNHSDPDSIVSVIPVKKEDEPDDQI